MFTIETRKYNITGQSMVTSNDHSLRLSTDGCPDGSTSRSVIGTNALETPVVRVSQIVQTSVTWDLPSQVEPFILVFEVLERCFLLARRAIPGRTSCRRSASRSWAATWRDINTSACAFDRTQIKGCSFHWSVPNISIFPKRSWRTGRHVLTWSLCGRRRSKTRMNSMGCWCDK